MAMALATNFELLVARVELAVVGEEERVKLRLYRHVENERQHFGEWTWPVPRAPHSDAPSDYADLGALPFDVKANLAGAAGPDMEVVKTVVATAGVPPDPPFWLHLVKPYGSLGALPWEETLESLLDRPVLRLPDFTEPPPENARTLEVAVCCDISEDPGQIAQAQRMISALVHGSPRTETHVYVFAPPVAHGPLKSAFAKEAKVWMAPPAKAAADDTVPWMDIMARVLRGRSIDHVHFITRAVSTLAGPSLALSDPRVKRGATTRTRYCSPRALTAALTMLGAWSAGVSPTTDEDDARLRQFADALAQVRPGAVVYASSSEHLQELCNFVFSPSPRWPPRSGRSMVYAHPSRVCPHVSRPPVAGAATQQNAHLFHDGANFVVKPTVGEHVSMLLGRAPPAASSANTPAWLAATQRFVESVSLETARAHSADALGSASWTDPDGFAGAPAPLLDAACEEEAAVVHGTLTDIQTIVREFAGRNMEAEDG